MKIILGAQKVVHGKKKFNHIGVCLSKWNFTVCGIFLRGPHSMTNDNVLLFNYYFLN